MNVMSRLPGFIGPIPSATLDKTYFVSRIIMTLFPIVVNMYEIRYNQDMKTKKIKGFHVLRGGRDPLNPDPLQFLSAYITNTRLMGVEVLYIHWFQSQREEHFHQFFYYDAEEYGLETYHSYRGNDSSQLAPMESYLTGGLGGEKIQINEKEAIFLLQEYVARHEILQKTPPKNQKQFQFLLETPVKLSLGEEQELLEKRCVPLTTSSEALHYFLMRVFAKDPAPLPYLTHGKDVEWNLFPELPPCTLTRNAIEKVQDSFLCESLLDMEDQYYIALTELEYKEGGVVSFQRKNLFSVTPYEAAMLLSRTEYVTCYQILGAESIVLGEMPKISNQAFMTPYDKGKLFMVYNPTNNHVKNQLFKLHDDVFGCYFVTDYGQLLVSSYVREHMTRMEEDLAYSSLGSSLVPLGRFEFKDPVLYEFIQDDMEDFLDFIEFYQE